MFGDERKLRARGRSARRGWTLVEALVVISMAAGVIGVVTSMLIGVLRVSGKGLNHVAERGVIGRLAERFRADVTAAQECRPLAAMAEGESDRKSGIALKGTEQYRVEYLASANAVERVVYTGEHVERRETYRLGEGRTARLENVPQSPTMVRCLLEPPASGGDMAPSSSTDRANGKSVTILAVLGRDRRYQRVAPAVEEKPAAQATLEPAENDPAAAENP